MSIRKMCFYNRKRGETSKRTAGRKTGEKEKKNEQKKEQSTSSKQRR